LNSEELIQSISNIVEEQSKKDTNVYGAIEQIEITTKEALCVASADAMTHIEQVPSLLHLVYYKRNMGVTEGANWVSKKIEWSWNKLCTEGKKIIKEKYESAQIILKS